MAPSTTIKRGFTRHAGDVVFLLRPKPNGNIDNYFLYEEVLQLGTMNDQPIDNANSGSQSDDNDDANDDNHHTDSDNDVNNQKLLKDLIKDLRDLKSDDEDT